MRFSLSTVVALGALQTLGVYAQDCINTCVDQVKPSVPNCPDPNDAACVCVSTEFAKGIAECARAPGCDALDDAITSALTGGFCVGQTVPPFPAAAATSDAATTSEAPATETTSAPGAPETTSALGAAETTSAPAPDAVTTSSLLPDTPQAPEATPIDSAETPDPTVAEESASATDADSSSATSEAAAADATSDPSSEKEGDGESNEDEGSSETGMSSSAKAGVGVGVTLGVLALLGVAGFFFWKKRRSQQDDLPRGNMAAMSPPMSSGSRGYPSPDQGSFGEKHGGYDLEIMSNRYEDMLPREEPRHMV
ncbi:hypothetical protein F66182_7794 [Fusarium sp. NRRL 66182]|nr:hypothetical protein F66182_7794 [Fusarium sp. NRRL 66182]